MRGNLKLFELKNRKLKDKAYEKQKDNYRSHYRNNRNNICYFLCTPCRAEKYVIKSHNDPPTDSDLFIVLL